MKIIGAGLAGLIAAHAFPQARIMERAAGPLESHRALLRFRDEGVSRLVGIPFKKVTVRKGIFDDMRFTQPTIALANAYSLKCLGRIEADRSIWAQEAVERWIAPDDFYAQMMATTYDRISFGIEWDYRDNEPVISTAPLPVVVDRLGLDLSAHSLDFQREPIRVMRYRIEDCDAYQTVYFPGNDSSMYRASITGNTLIVEHAGSECFGSWDGLLDEAFALHGAKLFPLDDVDQKYGKIAKVNDGERRRLLFRLTTDHNIFSLGRFATWRNILLCDLPHDIEVLRRMMRNCAYDRHLASILSA